MTGIENVGVGGGMRGSALRWPLANTRFFFTQK